MLLISSILLHKHSTELLIKDRLSLYKNLSPESYGAIMQDTNVHLSILFSKYHDALEKYCTRLVHYDSKYRTLVEDSVQIAFLKALNDPESFNQSPNQYGWLAVCCKNHIFSKLRQQKNREEIVGKQITLDRCCDIEDPTDAIIRWINSSDSRKFLNSLYASLSSSEKQIFEDYYLHDCSLQETANRNNLTIGSVRGAVERIRKKAKKMKFL